MQGLTSCRNTATCLLTSSDLSLLICTLGITIPLQALGLLWGSDDITQQIALPTFQRAVCTHPIITLSEGCTQKQLPPLSFLQSPQGPVSKLHSELLA